MSFLAELKRRNVIRMAGLYLVGAWLLTQVASTILPVFGAPEWVVRSVVVILAIGFVPALIFSWVFELTPEGLKRDEDVPPGQSIAPQTARRMDRMIILVLALALGYFAFDKFILAPRREAALIRKSTAGHPMSSPNDSKADAKSIAVLPFENRSEDKANAFFADGIQAEILRGLAKIADLKVISGPSVAKYHDLASLDLKQIATTLATRYFLEGSVQRSTDRIRVQTQLIDATTNIQVWAEHYDRQLSDIFAIQTEIAENIVTQLQARFTPEEKAAIEIRPTQDIQAYKSYVTATGIIDRVIYDSNLIEDLRTAEGLLEQATGRDPKFFLAFCKLAYVHDQLYFNSLDHTDTRLEKAKAALDTARELQPDAGEVHLAAAAHYYFGYLDYDKAREELTIAQAKLPNDPYPILLLGYIDRRQGHWNASTRRLEHALSLDPRNLLFLKQVALSYTMLRRYPDVINIFDRAIAVAPDDPNFIVQRATVELDWHADTKPLHAAIDQILAADPTKAATIADHWLYLAFCEKDMAAASQALEAMTENGCQEEGLPYPRSWCEGLVAREKKDDPAAKLAFTEARSRVDRLVHEQPGFAGAISVLGMIDAALGNKNAAIAEGRKAVELLPVGKDAITGSTLLQNLAVIYASTGETQAAFDVVKQLVGMPGYLSYGQLSLHPYWAHLRDDPSFSNILKPLEPKG
jgi:TolB-like protein/Flp pilus assembly protein TadD